jgi:hypothetical protein
MTEETRQIHPQALPNYQAAVVPRAKLEEYVLNPAHDLGRHKAIVFKSALGFEQRDWELLRQRKTADIVTGWIIRRETDFPSLVTARVAKK